MTGGAASKLAKIKVVRKSMRVLTVYNQTQKTMLRKAWGFRRYVPLDLRYKKTRAQRRARSRRPRRRGDGQGQVGAPKFPARRFALKA